MATRYLVTSREPDGETAILETESIVPVARVDRGYLADLESDEAERLAGAGLRVKPLVGVEQMRLYDYTIDVVEGATPDVPDLPGDPTSSAVEGTSSSRNHLVQFVGPIQESWLAALHDRGVDTVEPIGQFGYFVQADADVADALRGLPFVAWVGPFEPAYKVNPALLAEPGAAAGTVDIPEADAGFLSSNDGSEPPAIVGVNVGVLADADVAPIVGVIEANDGVVLDVGPVQGRYRNLLARFSDGAIGALAALDEVRWLDPMYESTLEDERTAQISYEDLDGAAAPNTAPIVGYNANLTVLGLNGAGTTIGICDTGVSTNDAATMHADLSGRFVFAVNGSNGAVTNPDGDGHGTHVAGIAAGNGASGDTDPQGFLLGQGVAPGASHGAIVATSTWTNRIDTAAQNGADVVNSSLGVNPAGSAYSASDRAIDLGVRDADGAGGAGNRAITLVFSAGNSGPGAQTCTKATKNAIVVGNALNFRPGEGDPSDDIRGLRTSSSRGPTADGRIFPVLTAPGTDVVSARGGFRGAYTDTGGTVHNTHARLTGTSMAAPVVTGMCALLTEWWRTTRSGATPSPATLKALLAVSTEPVTGGDDGNGGTIAAGPTNDAGWGRVSLENTVLQSPASDHGVKIVNDQRHAFTASGQEYRIRVAAADPSLPLRVALAWTDAAGSVGVSPTLVNDLDLEVVELDSGDVYVGNNFAGAFSTPGGTADSLNNLEQVAIANPTGVYEVSVIASNLTDSARTDIAGLWQDFALVIDNGEVPAAAPVNVVPVIDRSGSMQAFDYVDRTRQASRQFIDFMTVDDSFGVVSFGDAATQEFPPGGGLATIVGPTTRDDGKTAVDNISFGGCTFMGDGIETAGNMLAGAGPDSAIVLLSDGYDNKGCDQSNPARPSAVDAAAALPAGMPVYSCAMGPSSDQATLEQLATMTDGLYYYMPTIDDLFEIYNYIRGQVTGEGVIVNETATASRSQVRGHVDACSEAAAFSVAWHAPDLRYVSREARRPGEISIRLRTPSGRWLPHSASEIDRRVGKGYVVFGIEDPQPGWWAVEVSTNRDQHTPYTVGGFVRSDIQLELATPRRLTVGQKAAFTAVVTDARRPVSGVRMTAAVSAPSASLRTLVEKHQRQLDRVKVPDELVRDGQLTPDRIDAVKLQLLRDALLASGGHDIMERSLRRVRFGAGRPLPPRRSPHGPFDGANAVQAVDAPAAVSAGLGPGTGIATGSAVRGRVVDLRRVPVPVDRDRQVGRYGAVDVAGSYSIELSAAGFSRICRSRFVRRASASFVAVDRDD